MRLNEKLLEHMNKAQDAANEINNKALELEAHTVAADNAATEAVIAYILKTQGLDYVTIDLVAALALEHDSLVYERHGDVVTYSLKEDQ